MEVLREETEEPEAEEEKEAEDSDESLLEALKNLRRSMAASLHKAPKSIFTDEVLSSLALQRPSNTEELKQMPGNRKQEGRGLWYAIPPSHPGGSSPSGAAGRCR